MMWRVVVNGLKNVIRGVVRTFVVNLGVVLLVMGYLRWKRGLGRREIEEVILGWVRRVLRVRFGLRRGDGKSLIDTVGAAGSGLGRRVDGVYRGFTGAVRESGVSFLPATARERGGGL